MLTVRPLIKIFLLATFVASNASAQLGDNLGSILGSGSEEFLPVERAYSANVEFVEPNQLRIDWVVEPGYYLYRDRFDYHTAENTAVTPQYEEGVVKYDEWYEEELEVYYNSTTVALQGNFASQEMVLEYQGCADAGLCYPPAFYKFVIDPASGSVEPLGKVSSAVFATTSGNGATLSSIEGSNVSSIGFIGAFVLAFLGGIILNAMPCVFPVLSLKALSLAKGSKGKADLLSQSAFYALGSIAVAVGLAAVLLAIRAAGEAVGWGFQLQSPITITVLLYVFMVMALSLSGAFVFGTSLMGLGQQIETGNKYSQSFLTGALAMFVASPCTAPFMGSALAYAVTQPWFTALPVFAALGLGMALPIVLISLFPSLLEKLPKPGPWLDSFKQFLAFPLYLTCIWLLWVLIRQIDANGIALILGGLVLTVFAIWMLQQTTSKIRWAPFAAILFAAVVSAKTGISTEPAAPRTAATASLSLSMLSDSVGGSEPVFVNLTADWCITCIVNEKRALGTAETETLFEEESVQYMVGDWTRQDEDISEILTRYGRVSVPLYLFYPANSTEPQILPQFLTNDVIANLFE